MWVKKVVARGEKSGLEVDGDAHESGNETDDSHVGDGFERTGVRQGYERWKKVYMAEHANQNG
jgi:hypothetical protein